MALHARSTFAAVRVSHAERAAEAAELLPFCDQSRTEFRAFANCHGARREALHGGGILLALEETARLLLTDAVDALQRRTRDAVVTLGMTGLLALGALGLAGVALDRRVAAWLQRRDLQRQYREFSEHAKFRNQVHVPIRLRDEAYT